MASAAFDGTRRRGVKRSLQSTASSSPRPDLAFESGGPVDLLRTPQAPTAKRARTQDNQGGGGLIRAVIDMPGGLFNWFSTKFFGGGRRGAAPTPSDSVEEIDTAAGASSNQPIDFSSRGRAARDVPSEEPPLLDLTHEEDENGEVQIVEERLASPAHKEPSPMRFGAMSYGPLFQRQRGFEVVTGERRAKERAAAHPKSIYEAVRKSKLTAAKKPSVNADFWLSKTAKGFGTRFPLQKTAVFKSSASRGTPRVDPNQAFNKDDLEKYAKILYGKNSSVEFSPYAFPSALKNKLSRTSLFSTARKQSRAITSGAISQHKPKKIGQEDGLTGDEPSKRPEVIALKDEDERPSTSYATTGSSLLSPAMRLQQSSRSAPLRSSSTAAAAVKSSPSPNFKPKNLSHPDADVIEIINLYSPAGSPKADETDGGDVTKRCQFKDEVEVNPVVQENYLTQLRDKYVVRKEEADRLISEERIRDKHNSVRVGKLQRNVEERLRQHLKISDVAIPEPPPAESSESEEEDEVEEVVQLPEISDEMEEVINMACQSRGETLVDAHMIKITRKDVDTLKGLNWLNDEVINFYMQMIVQRGKDNDNFPKIYAANTFFYPKLMQSGHSALKRWTRKVDIFAQDLMLIPVHLGMHWCLATIDFKKKGVYYYDSMGGNNNQCITALLQYLQDEHLDKKKAPFDTSDWEAVIVKDIPQQMNGSDCGMFTCKFAEYLSRNAAITFTQADMPYFRKRIIWEIVKNTLLHP